LLKSKVRFDIVQSFERTVGQDIYRAGDGCHREWLLRRSLAESAFKNFCIAINPLHLYYLSIERKIFDSTPLVVANSEQVKAEIVQHYQVPAERLRVVYTGVDRERFRPENRSLHRERIRKDIGVPAEVPLVLFVGGGFKRKGLAGAVRAVAELDSSAAYLAVAGRGDEDPYRRLAAEKGLAQRVRFLGSRSDVEALYGAADVFCLPTLYDPCSNACLEALASGLPVVTSTANGASEAISEGRNGLVVTDPLDVAALAEALRSALALEPGKVLDASDQTLRPYDWELHRKAMLDCYEEVLAARGKAKAAA
jgi:UDP-glucose:(heptosyl)LPS alpha-1,3-glucosyltransferase